MGSGYRRQRHTGEAALEAGSPGKSRRQARQRSCGRARRNLTWAYFRPAGLIGDQSRRATRRERLVAWGAPQLQTRAPLPSPLHTTFPNQLIQYHPAGRLCAKAPIAHSQPLPTSSPASHIWMGWPTRRRHRPASSSASRISPIPAARVLKRLPRTSAGDARNQRPSTDSALLAEPTKGLCRCLRRGGRSIRPAKRYTSAVSFRLGVGRGGQSDGLRNQIYGRHRAGHWRRPLREKFSLPTAAFLNPRFAQYRLPRFSDVPRIEVVLIDRKDLPSAGAGETGIVGLAPAVGNAIFAATGIRLLNMPMAPGSAVPGESDSTFRS